MSRLFFERFMKAKKILQNVYYIPGSTNVGVVAVPKKFGKTPDLYLIDSGGDREDAKRIYNELCELFPAEEGGFKLKAIINTHSHADHCGGNAFFVQKTGCKIWINDVEAAGLKNNLLQSIIHCGSMPLPHLQTSYFVAEPSKADRFIDSSVKIKLRDGSCFSFMDLPGHYLNMLGVIYTNKKGETVLFSGDAINGRNLILKYWISYLVDLEAFKNTLCKLNESSFTWYVPCHGDVVQRIQETVEMNQIAILSTEASILKALEGGKELTFSEVMKAVADMNELNLRTAQYLLIGGTIKAYLYYLYDQKKIDCTMKENQLFWKKC